MTNLRQAREQGKLDQFIKEREAEKGDPKAFNRAVRAMARKSKEAPKASSPRNSDD
jgi:hypothetical protein